MCESELFSRVEFILDSAPLPGLSDPLTVEIFDGQGYTGTPLATQTILAGEYGLFEVTSVTSYLGFATVNYRCQNPIKSSVAYPPLPPNTSLNVGDGFNIYSTTSLTCDGSPSNWESPLAAAQYGSVFIDYDLRYSLDLLYSQKAFSSYLFTVG